MSTIDSTDSAPVDTFAYELSVVMPCLNEADTLEVCIEKALRAMKDADIHGEVVVADNGSTDGSIEIGERCGARIVHVEAKGYGNALMGGIEAAKGKFVIMGDADDSYDFLEIPKFVEKLREGAALVQGCRLPSGGGTVLPGAMPFTHRWIGNPMFSRLVRSWFKAPIHDVYCGLRGFTKEHYQSLDQRCVGMEFATEMIIRSSVMGADIREVPISLHPDGRKAHAPHLNTVRDGWRTLRYFLMYSPRNLFQVPGWLLIGLGILGYGLALPGVQLGGATFDAHTLLFATVAIICGYQSLMFAVFAKTFAIHEKLVPFDPGFAAQKARWPLEKGLVIGLIALLGGVGLLGGSALNWVAKGFSDLDYASTMRVVIPGALLTTLGVQTLLNSFFVSILDMGRK